MRPFLRAHPRSRGEHNDLNNLEGVRKGSSPLARGTHLFRVGSVEVKGLIPARAGNTLQAHEPRSHRRAHPRSRGEHRSRLLDEFSRPGSSPLARGTLKLFGFFLTYRGLIPARAGNTPQRETAPHEQWAHPRSRGEHRQASRQAGHLSGSSPLARGTLGFTLNLAKPRGLIPARAGNTVVRSASSCT